LLYLFRTKFKQVAKIPEQLWYFIATILGGVIWWVIQLAVKSSRDKSKERDTFEKGITDTVNNVEKTLITINAEIITLIKDIQSETKLDKQKIRSDVEKLADNIIRIEDQIGNLQKRIDEKD